VISVISNYLNNTQHLPSPNVYI